MFPERPELPPARSRDSVADAIRAKPRSRARAADGPHAGWLLPRAGALAERGHVDFSRRHDVQPRRVPRASRRRIPAAIAASWRRTCSAASTCQPSQINFLNGAAPDPEAECERYEQAIARRRRHRPADPRHRHQRPHRFQRAGRELQARTHRVTLKAGDPAQQRGAVRRRSGRRAARRRCRWGWRRSFRRDRSSCSRPGSRRRRASSGCSAGRSRRSCRRRSCSCTPPSRSSSMPRQPAHAGASGR